MAEPQSVRSSLFYGHSLIVTVSVQEKCPLKRTTRFPMERCRDHATLAIVKGFLLKKGIRLGRLHFMLSFK